MIFYVLSSFAMLIDVHLSALKRDLVSCSYLCYIQAFVNQFVTVSLYTIFATPHGQPCNISKLFLSFTYHVYENACI